MQLSGLVMGEMGEPSGDHGALRQCLKEPQLQRSPSPLRVCKGRLGCDRYSPLYS